MGIYNINIRLNNTMKRTTQHFKVIKINKHIKYINLISSNILRPLKRQGSNILVW